MKEELIRIHNALMQITVKGENVPFMAEALVNLTRIINSMPDEVEAEAEPCLE